MDKVGQVMSNASLEVLKEPRGFIKVIQLIIAIFAFATTTSHNTKSEFTVQCPGTPTPPLITKSYTYGYAYRLSDIRFEVPFCEDQKTDMVGPYGSFSAPAEFYVFVGVMAFLYCIAALVLYVGFDEKYRKFDNVPIIDFVISIIFTLLWLIASSAWAQGVHDVKMYSNPNNLFLDRIPECQNSTITCTSTKTGNFASLNVSLIFGYLNMLVWGANLWFLFKETRWFKMREAPPQSQQPVSPSQEPQKV